MNLLYISHFWWTESMNQYFSPFLMGHISAILHKNVSVFTVLFKKWWKMCFLSTTTQPDSVLTIPCNQCANMYNNVNMVFFVLSIYLTFITSALKCSMKLQVEYFLIERWRYYWGNIYNDGRNDMLSPIKWLALRWNGLNRWTLISATRQADRFALATTKWLNMNSRRLKTRVTDHQ